MPKVIENGATRKQTVELLDLITEEFIEQEIHSLRNGAYQDVVVSAALSEIFHHFIRRGFSTAEKVLDGAGLKSLAARVDELRIDALFNHVTDRVIRLRDDFNFTGWGLKNRLPEYLEHPGMLEAAMNIVGPDWKPDV